MNNSEIAISVLCGLGIVPLLNSCSSTKSKTLPEKPNILFILVDDLGWNDLSCTGSTYYETPNVDKLASTSTIFTQGYAACSVSSPSRASILTGVNTVDHNITNWIGAPQGIEQRKLKRHCKMLPPFYSQSLKKGYTTIAEALKANGYSTYFYGKWHIGGEEQHSLPTDHGFEENIGGYKAGSPGKGGYFSPYMNPKLKDGPKGENLSWRLATECAKRIKTHMTENPEKPFFSMLSFYAVHGQNQTTKENWQYFRDKIVQQGYAKKGFKMDRILPVRQYQDNPVYAGLLRQMDNGVGIVLDELKKLGIMDNTLIIFTGDNGGVSSGDDYSSSMLPLRGGKGTQWEGGTRVPYIIKEPLQKEQRMCDTPVDGIDFFPTILDYAHISLTEALKNSENIKVNDKDPLQYNTCGKRAADAGIKLAGVPEPDGGLVPSNKIDGVSIKALVEGDTISSRNLYWTYPHYSNQGGEPSACVRSGDWKLILYFEDGRSELYNLKKDISEQHILNDTYPEKVKELRQELENWLIAHNAAMPSPDPQYDPILRKQYLEKMKKSIITREKRRMNRFQKTYKPNEDWWGSYVPE